MYLHDYVTHLKRKIQSYFVEAKWLNQGYTPTFDQYLSNALVSSSHTVLIATSFVGMGDVVTQEVFQWVLSRLKMIRASELVGRLMNDSFPPGTYKILLQLELKWFVANAFLNRFLNSYIQ